MKTRNDPLGLRTQTPQTSAAMRVATQAMGAGPAQILEAMSDAQLEALVANAKRWRRRFVAFSLNGAATYVARKLVVTMATGLYIDRKLKDERT